MDEVLKKCLESAKRINPGVKFIQAADYGSYYVFSYIQRGEQRTYPAINKSNFTKKDDWQSANIILDKCYGAIDLTKI